MRKFIIIFILIVMQSCVLDEEIPEEPDLVSLEWVNFGEIKPQGWILDQMNKDLEEGFVGRLDSLVPELIIEDDIYGEDRLTQSVESKDLGVDTVGGDWKIQMLWWNSETQSNWWDGLIRHAILTQNDSALQRVRNYVEEKLETQDRDGYLGIYADDLRYHHDTENGELWAQASLMRGMLAYYEATGDQDVLDAVERAVKMTMAAYPPGNSTPFKIEEASSGVGHGLTLTDVLDRLSQLTGNQTYLDYAVFLVTDYDENATGEVDIQTKNLLDPKYKFKGHGVHIYEHLRSLTVAALNSADSSYTHALDNYLEKLSKVINPSGGPVGDEWVAGRNADPNSTGYEYCSIHELLDSYSLLLQKTTETKWADNMEWLLFNAGQGSRHPYEHSIAYCKSDNSFSMMGGIDPEDSTNLRFKYSPVHQEVAVCCVPNAGRIYPYYVRSMWMRSARGLVAQLFGPSVIETMVDDYNVRITQVTKYPFELKVQFIIEAEQPTRFQLAIRKPGWATGLTLNTDTTFKEDEQYYFLEKTWNSGDTVILEMQDSTKVNQDLSDGYFVSHGPLVYALPLEGDTLVTKTYGDSVFKDLFYKPTTDPRKDFQMIPNASFEIKYDSTYVGNPWTSGLKISTQMFDPIKETETKVILVPMGGTILRRVSFEAMKPPSQ